MSGFYPNVIEDQSLVLDENGGSVVTAHVLDDVPGGGDAMLWNAVLDARIPRYGQPHPVVPGLRVTNIAATALDIDKAKVTVTYSRPASDEDTPYEPDTGPAADPEGRGTMSLSATVQDVETQRALDGAALLVLYTGELTDEDGNPVEVENDPQVATVTVGRPMAVVTFTRKETASPISNAMVFVGAINSGRLGIFPPQTLLCSRIDATTSDDGLTFDVSYEFQFNRETWTAFIAYIDPETGQPPADIDQVPFPAEEFPGDRFPSLNALGNGTAVYDIYPQRDFGVLNLPWQSGGKRRV